MAHGDQQYCEGLAKLIGEDALLMRADELRDRAGTHLVAAESAATAADTIGDYNQTERRGALLVEVAAYAELASACCNLAGATVQVHKISLSYSRALEALGTRAFAAQCLSLLPPAYVGVLLMPEDPSRALDLALMASAADGQLGGIAFASGLLAAFISDDPEGHSQVVAEALGADVYRDEHGHFLLGLPVADSETLGGCLQAMFARAAAETAADDEA